MKRFIPHQLGGKPLKNRRLEISSFSIGIVTGIGLAVTVGIGGGFLLEASSGFLLGGFVSGVSVSTTLLILIHINREKIIAKLLGGVKIRVRELLLSLQDLLWRREVGERGNVGIVDSAGALISWYLARRTLVLILLWMIGGSITVLTTIVLLRQTAVLEIQTERIGSQTELLKRQNEILAGEGQWELLWKSHFGGTTQAQMEAIVGLKSPNGVVRGVILSRLQSSFETSQPSLVIDWNHPEELGLRTNTTPENLPEVEVAALEKLSMGEVRGWLADYSRTENKGASDMRFVGSRVVLEGCEDCDFIWSNVVAVSGLLNIRRCKGEGSRFVGRVVMLQGCDAKSVVMQGEINNVLSGVFEEVVVVCGSRCVVGTNIGTRIRRLVILLDEGEKRPIERIVPFALNTGRMDEIRVAKLRAG